MNNTYSIEKTILVSVLEHDFIQNDKEILKVPLNAEIFSHPIHKLFVNAINRLKQLDEPTSSDFMRARFLKANKWDKLTHEVQLLEILSHNPLATVKLFKSYLKILEDKYMMSRVAV